VAAAPAPAFCHALDSVGVLLGHNAAEGAAPLPRGRARRRRDVHVIFGKPLVGDRVTVEYAARIRRAVRILQGLDGGGVRPSVVCFCGGVRVGNHISDAGAGYALFRQMCEYRNISLEGIDIVVDSESTDDFGAVRRVVEEARSRISSGRWTAWDAGSDDGEEDREQENRDGDGEDNDQYDQYDQYNQYDQYRGRIDVHFVLISCEYHLCNLNDVHYRSPRQSLLKPIQGLQGRAPAPKEGPWRRERDQITGETPPSLDYVLKPSWSFQYATYPFIYAKDDATAFLGKCYVLGQHLTPLLVNIKGVVEKKEFFQRDNYFTLTAVRRALVDHAEALHRPRKSLRTSLALSGGGGAPGAVRADGARYVDVALERAAAALGRCGDLVRPAGLLQRSVPTGDWATALEILDACVGEILGVCDPDRALGHGEWMEAVVRGGDEEAAPADEVVEAILGGGSTGGGVGGGRQQ